MATVDLTLTLVLVDCCTCHLQFAVPREWNAERRRKKDSWSCPAGHWQSYTGESEEQKLRRQLREQEQRTARANARATAAQDQADAAERSRRAYKGQATRARRKAVHGVCPAPGCGRTFQDLQRHVAGQHPQFLAEHGPVQADT